MMTDTTRLRLITDIAEKLGSKKLTLCTAESCTGGLTGALCTSVPGSSAWFMGGIIAYANSIKEHLLKVPAEVLRQYGAVSRETAGAMLTGALQACAADCAIAITGVAGPDGGNAEKPVGFVITGIAVPGRQLITETTFHGDRAAIRLSAATQALQMLNNALD
jgi:PncC family amidohydrolase